MSLLFFNRKLGYQSRSFIRSWKLESIWIVLLAVFILGLAINLKTVSDYDLFFNLIVGERVFSTWSVPHQEFYIYSAIDEPTIFVGWLYGTILYVVWKAFGYEGLSVLNALLWAGVWTLLSGAYLTFWRKEQKGSLSLATACLFMALILCVQVMIERPMLRAEVSMFLAWGIASLTWARFGMGKRLLLIVVPGLAWGLAWLHSTSIFMLIFWCCLLADRLWDVFIRKSSSMDHREIMMFVGSLVMTCLLPLANPNGPAQVLPLLMGFIKSQTVPNQPGDIVIEEYTSIFYATRSKPLALMLAASSLFVLIFQRERRGFNLLSLSVGTVLGCLHLRALSIWALFLIIPLADSLCSFLGPKMAAQKERWLVRRAPLLLSMLAIVALVSIVPNKIKGGWGVGLLPGFGCPNAINVIKKRYPEGGNVFGIYALGSVLRWQLGSNYQVAMDGHFVTLTRAIPRYQLVVSGSSEWEKILDDDKVVAVVHPLLYPTGVIWLLPMALLNSPNWILASVDDMGVTFVRRKEGEQVSGDEELRTFWLKIVVDAVKGPAAIGTPEEKRKASEILETAKTELSRLDAAQDER